MRIETLTDELEIIWDNECRNPFILEAVATLRLQEFELQLLKTTISNMAVDIEDLKTYKILIDSVRQLTEEIESKKRTPKSPQVISRPELEASTRQPFSSSSSLF